MSDRKRIRTLPKRKIKPPPPPPTEPPSDPGSGKPVETPKKPKKDLAPKQVALPILTRDQWGALRPKYGDEYLPKPIRKVVFTCNTGTRPCSTPEECSLTLQALQLMHMEENGYPDIAFNFMVGGDGAIYEGRGWNHKSQQATPADQEFSHRVDIGFIGEYTPVSLPVNMLRSSLCFLHKHVEKGDVIKQYHRQIFEVSKHPY